MANFVRHTSCDSCGSSDGFAIYDDDSGYCFVCEYTIASEEYKNNNHKNNKNNKRKPLKIKTTEKEAVSVGKDRITPEENEQIKEQTTVKANNFRGIRDETLGYFGVRSSINEFGEVEEMYHPCTINNELSGYKIREIPKTFYSKGVTGAECDMFGAFRFTKGGKYLVITEGECLLPTTKILTKNGWVSLRDYTLSDGEVMQGNGKFAFPLAITIKDFSGKLIEYKSGSYKTTVTPDHNMVRLRRGEQIKVKAKDLTKKQLPVPRTVVFNELEEEDLFIRLQVMFSADFTFSGNAIRGAFKNKRKIDRCRHLLNSVNFKYTESINAAGYTCFYVSTTNDLKRYSKIFNYSDMKYAKIIIDELVHWDGNKVPNRNQIEFSTKYYENAKFIQTCSHISGYTSTIIKRKNQFGEWYKVSILFNKQTSSTQKGYTEIDYNGTVMCLTVPDGTLLVSEDDSISITGNCDQLSAYQMLSDYNKKRGSDFEIAVVSPTTGANCQKQISNNYKFFDSFENIIMCFDNDEPGKKATEKLIKYLPKGKVKILSMSHKDANEYLTKGDEKLFIQDFWNAKKYVPVGIVASNEISEFMREELSVEKIPLPPFMYKLQTMMAGGIPLGRIINLSSASGSGKSTIVDELIYYWIFNSPHKNGVVTLESTVGQYGVKLLSRHLGLKLELMDNKNALDFVNDEQVKIKEKELFSDENNEPRFYLIDDRDGDVENIQDAIENLIISCDCKVIICDPISDIIASLPLDEQEHFMNWQKGMVKSHGVTFINVCHTRKTSSGQKAGSAGADLHEEDIIGSSSLYKSAACNLMFSRNKEAEDNIERNTITMKATKIRWTGKTGIAGKYYYDIESHTLHDLDDYLSNNFT